MKNTHLTRDIESGEYTLHISEIHKDRDRKISGDTSKIVKVLDARRANLMLRINEIDNHLKTLGVAYEVKLPISGKFEIIELK